MKRASIVACAVLALSSSSGARYSQAIVALVDVSGTYADQRPEVVDVIRKGLLPRLTPGDTLVVIRIDNESYGKQNVEANMTLDAFAHKRLRSGHTDIRGAMMLGAEYLRETNAGRRTMVVFSDMEEDLPRGVKRDMAPDELKGVRVLAMNVKRLARDNANPTAYRARLAGWEKQLTSHGAREFKVVLEAEKLAELIDEG